MEKQKKYKIRRTYINEKGVLCCDYTGEWGVKNENKRTNRT